MRDDDSREEVGQIWFGRLVRTTQPGLSARADDLGLVRGELGRGTTKFSNQPPGKSFLGLGGGLVEGGCALLPSAPSRFPFLLKCGITCMRTLLAATCKQKRA